MTWAALDKRWKCKSIETEGEQNNQKKHPVIGALVTPRHDYCLTWTSIKKNPSDNPKHDRRNATSSNTFESNVKVLKMNGKVLPKPFWGLQNTTARAWLCSRTKSGLLVNFQSQKMPRNGIQMVSNGGPVVPVLGLKMPQHCPVAKVIAWKFTRLLADDVGHQIKAT